MKKDVLYELALFSGAGGGILGGHTLGFKTICAVEIDPYAAGVLVQRQNDLVLPTFPIWDDVGTFDAKPWRGVVDIISGGFPCQDISCAGKGAGITGKRSGLWKEFARIIRDIRPDFVFVENSPALTTRGLDVVLCDLASLGYDAEWCVLGADDAGAPHRRKRIWILGYTNSKRLEKQPDAITERERNAHCKNSGNDVSNPTKQFRTKQGRKAFESGRICQNICDSNSKWKLQQKRIVQKLRRRVEHSNWWKTEPRVGRVVDGVANRVDRLKALGNGQVPGVAGMAFKLLYERMLKR